MGGLVRSHAYREASVLVGRRSGDFRLGLGGGRGRRLRPKIGSGEIGSVFPARPAKTDGRARSICRIWAVPTCPLVRGASPGQGARRTFSGGHRKCGSCRMGPVVVECRQPSGYAIADAGASWLGSGLCLCVPQAGAVRFIPPADYSGRPGGRKPGCCCFRWDTEGFCGTCGG